MVVQSWDGRYCYHSLISMETDTGKKGREIPHQKIPRTWGTFMLERSGQWPEATESGCGFTPFLSAPLEGGMAAPSSPDSGVYYNRPCLASSIVKSFFYFLRQTEYITYTDTLISMQISSLPAVIKIFACKENSVLLAFLLVGNCISLLILKAQDFVICLCQIGGGGGRELGQYNIRNSEF